MKSHPQNRRVLRWGAALLVLLAPLAVSARTRKPEAWAQSQFEAAERTREALNGRPAEERSRREYRQAITAYQRVYFGAPASSKAAPSVIAAAELMVEMGRRFDDARMLRSSIKQYEFLRREYPGSKYRFNALFTVGEIYKDDLNDQAKARETFQEFLRSYPHHHLAEDARQALAEPSQPASLKSKEDTARNSRNPKDIKGGSGKENSDSNEGATSGKISRVTGIRHWSTPDYTRVAIDLEQDIKYEFQRINHPDRIFFDLMDTQLASTLVGKNFDVDDGFLKKIRVAQYQPGRARVVLEVDELASYNAFLLSNPSRLIIDIHGKEIHSKPESKTKEPAPTQAKVEAKAAPFKTSAAPPAKETIAPKQEQPAPTRAKTESEKPVPSAITVSKTAPTKKTAETDDADDDSSMAAKLEPPIARTENAKPASAAASDKNGTKKKIVEVDPDDDSNSSTAAKVESEKPQSGSRSGNASSSSSSLATIKRTGARRNGKSGAPRPDAREARPTANGDRSLIRALGLKIGKIVIDAGHGGHDTGTIGPDGLEEKDLVLDVALRLGKMLENRLGAEVVYTRNDDTFIPLETRTAIANREQADLFVSVHANSSRDPDTRGVETYYLNFTSSSEALEVAARENAVSEKSIHELQDLVKKIALKEKIEESHEFATDVQQALRDGVAVKNSGIRNRGVKKAPFIVLIGANMPSILAEISFVSNPEDERRLKTAEYRQHIAESLYRGISKYVSGLSGVKVASTLNKSNNP